MAPYQQPSLEDETTSPPLFPNTSDFILPAPIQQPPQLEPSTNPHSGWSISPAGNSIPPHIGRSKAINAAILADSLDYPHSITEQPLRKAMAAIIDGCYQYGTTSGHLLDAIRKKEKKKPIAETRVPAKKAKVTVCRNGQLHIDMNDQGRNLAQSDPTTTRTARTRKPTPKKRAMDASNSSSEPASQPPARKRARVSIDDAEDSAPAKKQARTTVDDAEDSAPALAPPAKKRAKMASVAPQTGGGDEEGEKVRGSGAAKKGEAGRKGKGVVKGKRKGKEEGEGE